MVTIINAQDLILGRMASLVAQRTLRGESIAIVNAELAVISGNRARVLSIYGNKRARGSREGGPFFPRRPDQIMKRTIRGMLPYKRQRGAEALKRVKCYVGLPAEFAGQEMEVLEEAHLDRLSAPGFVTLGAISTYLGAKF